MKTPLALGLAAFLAGASALAQQPPRHESDTAAPVLAERALPVAAPVAIAEPEPAELELPQVPEQLADRVESLHRVALHATTCWSYHGERSDHSASPRCPGWFAQLTRGRAAAVYAIGQVLVESTQENVASEPDSDPRQVGERLLQIMAATRAPEAVPYLLTYIHRALARGDAALTEDVVHTLVAFTGHDPAPLAPWWTGPARDFHDTDRAWRRWYSQHQSETRDVWVMTGREQARQELASDDPVRRISAIRRLMTVPADRVAAQASLRDLIARTDLSADAASFLRRYAQQQRVPLPVRARARLDARAD